MGVMACDRRDCDNVMCDIMVGNDRYICSSCHSELMILVGRWPQQLPVSEIDSLIAEFFDSRPGESKKEDVESYVRSKIHHWGV